MYQEAMMLLLLLLAFVGFVVAVYWSKGLGIVDAGGECCCCGKRRGGADGDTAEERCMSDPVPAAKAQSARSKERRRRGKDPFKGVKGKKMLEKLEGARSVSSSSSSREPDTPTSPAPPDVERIPEEPIEFPTIYSPPTPTQLVAEARQREEEARAALERVEEMMHWEREAWRRREGEMQAQIHQLMYQVQAYAAFVSPTWYPIERGRRRRRDNDDDDDDDVSELLVDAILKRPERIIRKRAAS
ncbi:hypothetical protein IW261DRAFT_1493699 [Armillaria novae-zelandiae]|uniref:Uncharacterized protein n=1 Tax=Armillaria novae-zelandiae TaxID=153914 RepID=A0AA39TAE7_9AGAR|nr:hypothetical protein IW261DRAFT_1525829 [Armillaria novae-zelandiae]KAK0475931.1 hypothetical protein IW261DRAFT_1493699 [Armillaria novae-zelandiae]